MKKRLIAILLLTAAFLALCAVMASAELGGVPAAYAPATASVAPAETETAPPWDLSGHMALYRSVLLEGRSFYSAAADGEIGLEELDRAVGGEGTMVSVARFALLDMDGDGLPELLLWLRVNNDDSYGYQILRREGEALYGYTVWYKAMRELKSDGSFFSVDRGFGRMVFEGSDFRYESEAGVKDRPEPGEGLVTGYYVGGVQVDAAAFESALAAQSEKEAPVWHDYTEEKLREIFQ